MATNTLGEFSDGEDDFVFEIDENLWEWSDPEADDLIRNINEEEILARVYGNDDDNDELIRNIDENEVLAGLYGNDDDDDLIRNINEDEVLAQMGRGEKRKNDDDEEEEEEEEGQDYYVRESVKKYYSKKFGMTATDHKIRFNNVLGDFDLLESHESTQKIFHHLLEDVTWDMNPNDQVRFILRSDQLDTPISIPFLRVEQLTTERVFSQIERVIQSNQEFRLNDTVTIDINHVKTPEGRGKSKLKRTTLNIIIVSGSHNNSIIYPPQPPGTDEKPIISLYFHDNHFDVITKLPGFLNRSHFCKRCHKPYDHTTDHLCPAMCRSCRAFGCILEGEGMVCNECDRLFKNQACYDQHKEPVDGGGRSVCEMIRKCEKCGKVMDVRKVKDGGHICGKKCRTCGLILNQEDTDHKCYIQQLEQEEESSYNHLLFFDFEATQEHGTHCPNLCVVHDEEREVALFQGEDTVKNFCEWLLTPEHKGCIVVAHNFQGYDGYFITKFLIDNAIHYDIIYRGAKSLSMTIPMFNIKFIDSINFIPMSLAKFPKTFGQDELCKGYFPHMFNKEENQNYIGPIPCQNDYGVNFMKPGEREAFIAWHDEQVANNYRYDFREEIIKYCRSDVDIMRKCCLLYREMFRKETDIDPFNKALTIASYCQEVYRTNFLKKDTIAIFNNDRQLKIKQSNVAVKWLSYISEKEGLYIQHVRNGGEKRFGDYSLDGYCEETLTAYEFQGCFWHGKDFGDVQTYTNYE